MCSLEELILQIALVAGAIFSGIGQLNLYYPLSPPKIVILNLNYSVLLAARAIWRINSTNIAQPGTTILDVSFLEIDNVCIMT